MNRPARPDPSPGDRPDLLPPIAILNPAAGGGACARKWGRAEPLVRARFGGLAVTRIDERRSLEDCVVEALHRGHRRFLAVGGDGTVNGVLAALLDRAPAHVLAQVTLGAVGTGSSNDFHKPRRETIAGLPGRLDFDAAFRHDVGVLGFRDDAGRYRTRPWIVNASIGTTAEANRFFNRPDPLLRGLKRTWTSLAIAYAALRSVFATPVRPLELAFDGGATRTEPIRNLGVVKNPHFAGSLRYDSPYRPADGKLFVHRLGATRLPGLLRALFRLSRGRFAGPGAARSCEAREIRVRNGGAFAVEFDGEVVVAREVLFTVLPSKLRICP